jgi:hypothetical protein
MRHHDITQPIKLGSTVVPNIEYRVRPIITKVNHDHAMARMTSKYLCVSLRPNDSDNPRPLLGNASHLGIEKKGGSRYAVSQSSSFPLAKHMEIRTRVFGGTNESKLNSPYRTL